MATHLLVDGDAPFLKQEAMEAFVAKHADKGVRIFNGEDTSPDEIVEWSRGGFDFFGDSKIAVVRDIDSFKDEKDTFLKFLQGIVEEKAKSPVLMLVTGEGQLDKRLKLSKFITGAFKVVILNAPKKDKDDEWVSWLRGKANALGKEIGAKEAGAFLRFVGKNHHDLWRELRKVALYMGDRKQVEVDDLAKNLIRLIKHPPYEITEAVALRNSKYAMMLVRRFVRDNSSGDPGLVLLSLFMKLFEKMLVVAGEKAAGRPYSEIASVIGEKHGYYFDQKWDAFLAKWNTDQILDAMRRLRAADLNVKRYGMASEKQAEWVVASVLRT